jgi:agmatinase/guanidinopropionase
MTRERSNPNPAFGAQQLAYAGIPSFMRLPVSRDLDQVDVAVAGIPFDSGATSWRSGTRLGPRHIRANSLQLWGYNRVLNVGPLDLLRVVDYGDLAVDPTNINQTAESITAEAAQILATNTRLISLGGDHSVTYPLLKAHAEQYGPLAVVHFDAHTDTYRYLETLEHGTPFYLALKEGFIDPAAYIQVGIRGPLWDPTEVADAQELGAKVLTIETCFGIDMSALSGIIQDTIGHRPVYVSLDIDAVDPAFAPGTGTPEVGGFSSYQMLQLVRGLHGLNLVGFDLVEVNPAYDSGDITSILAANLVFEFLSLLALKKRSEES